jgi:hypothetical protein
LDKGGKATGKHQTSSSLKVQKATAIQTWPQFTAQIRNKDCKILKTLDQFKNAVLVTGCQRSGTTMLSRIIFQSEGMVNYWQGHDDELDAALILAGCTPAPSPGRYCFQTTYVDEHYVEYYEHSGDYKIIWVLRNPFSVVCSLLYNWPPRSLDGTFRACAVGELRGLDSALYHYFGIKAVSRVHKACDVFIAKTRQLIELYKVFGKEKILVVDYDDLVLNKESVLPKIYQFIDLPYKSEYHAEIHQNSMHKKSRLTNTEIRIIRHMAQPIYEKALLLKNV